MDELKVALLLSSLALVVSLLSFTATLYLLVSMRLLDWRTVVTRIRALWPSFDAAADGEHMPSAVQDSRFQSPRPGMKQVTLDAIFQEGTLKPIEPLDLPENSRVRISVEVEADAPGAPVSIPVLSILRRRLRALSDSLDQLSGVLSLDWALFTLALLAYAFTRLRALDQFPIYFFSDEAHQVLFAEELIARGFRGANGTLLPIYFEQAPQRWMPLLSVYFHVLTTGLFGKSIFVTRATSAIISVLGAAAVGLILKLVFKIRFWWAGVMLLAVTPAWLLHSRTAFETVMMTSFYACFLLCYLLYRYRSPHYLFAAVLFGAAAFYAYSNGQAIMAAVGILLFLSDIRYHLRHWRTVLLVLLLGGVLALPLIRFRLEHPTSIQEHLRVIDSYWFRAIPLSEKLTRFVETYWQGLNPLYWFVPNDHDLVRHRMKGYGHIRIELLPLVLIGVLLCLRNIRSSSHRTILLTALVTPVGAALVGIGITRVLSFVVPASILAGLGLEALLSRITRRISYDWVATAVFLTLLIASFTMLRRAIVEGPLWFRDYGLYGMQYGAEQLFEETIPQYLERDSDVQVMVTSSWANGANLFPLFFLSSSQQGRVQMRSVDAYLFEKGDLGDDTLLVMTSLEYERARTSPKFKTVEVEQVVPYPDGTPGFYFVRLAYVDNVEAIFAAEREERRRPVEEQIELGGQTVQVRHSRFDMGELHHMFDSDRFTLARVMEANPAMVEFIFPKPRTVTALAADFGSMDFSLTVELYNNEEANEPVSYTETYRGLPPDPHVEITFDRGPHTVSRMRLEIKDLKAGEVAKIHIRELTLK